MNANFVTSNNIYNILIKLGDEYDRVHELEIEEARLKSIIALLLKPESQRSKAVTKVIDSYKRREDLCENIAMLNAMPSKNIALINSISDLISESERNLDEALKGANE